MIIVDFVHIVYDSLTLNFVIRVLILGIIIAIIGMRALATKQVSARALEALRTAHGDEWLSKL